MSDRKQGILFMGTPEFAVPSLKGLVEKGYPILSVVTQPDRPRGRGRKSDAPPIKRFAEEHNIPVLQPERVRNEEFLRVFREIAPDMVVLVAFGQILPLEILEHPPMGCLNVHPSLLPLYRGAAPINWALIRGEEKTGVTIILMDAGVDSGDILFQEETRIGPEDNFDNLHDRLAQVGARLLLKAIEGVMAGEAKRMPQNHTLATYAPRLKKKDGHLSWDAGVRDILNRIRGLSSTPGAFSYLNGKQIKIFSASGKTNPTAEPPGRLGKETGEGLPVAASDGYVYLKEVQLEGKKRMLVREFLKGYRLSPDDILR